MDEFRWRNVPTEDSHSEYSWEWLLNAIDLGRVYSTLRDFPLDDKVIPLPLDLESQLSTPDIESVSMDDAVNVTETKEKVEPNTYDKKSKPESVRRYSPGFILPLLLAALKATHDTSKLVEESGQVPMLHTGENSQDGSEELLAGVTQRICEKGGLSLALAALCSKCTQLRQVSVSILGLCLYAMHTKAAREASSWRERPQLVMLLNSVQRALTVRRAVLLSKSHQNEEEESSGVSPWNVPMLPGVSAIFLARAAFVLTRPEDSMYGPLNRFFLSIDGDHGAFNDLNRLPAFISFLCSSSDEPTDQARKERRWALEHIRDGFLDEFCYRMVSTCHAPDLLLTSFYNFRLRAVEDAGAGYRQQEEECIVILRSITRFVERGGRQAAHHLFTRMGMMSWLRSILAGKDVLKVLPTLSCRIAFLQLTFASVYQATKYETSDCTPDPYFWVEVAALAHPILLLCLSSSDGFSHSNNLTKHPHRHGASLSSLFSLACMVLTSLRRALVVLEATSKPSEHSEILINRNARADGVGLLEANQFLAQVSSWSPERFGDSIAALVKLPFCPPLNDHDHLCRITLEFCKSALDLLKFRNPFDIVMQVLERVCHITRVFWKKNDVTLDESVRDDILCKLIACQKTCFQWQASRDLWFQCLGDFDGEAWLATAT